MWAEGLHNPYLLWALVLSMGSQHGEKIRSGYVSPAYSRAKNWARWLHNPAFLVVPSAQHREKIRAGCFTVASLGAPIWAR